MTWTLTRKLVWIARETQDLLPLPALNGGFLIECNSMDFQMGSGLEFKLSHLGTKHFPLPTELSYPLFGFLWQIIKEKLYLPPLILTGMKGFLVTFSTQIEIQWVLLYFWKYTNKVNQFLILDRFSSEHYIFLATRTYFLGHWLEIKHLVFWIFQWVFYISGFHIASLIRRKTQGISSSILRYVPSFLSVFQLLFII